MGATLMNFKAIKHLLFGPPKPFQMTREEIPDEASETAPLERLAEMLDTEPSKAYFEISQTSYLKPFVDYLKTYHQVGRGDHNDDFEAVQRQESVAETTKKLDFTVGLVADTFLYDALKGACHLYYINEHNRKLDYDFVIIASTWRGIDGYWEGNSNSHSSKFHELKALITNLRSRHIPVIFFNKEDPVNFDIFKTHAQLADYVVTTEVDYVEKYQELLGHRRVTSAHFPINPTLHHPIGTDRLLDSRHVVFAGSWLNKYSERSKDMRHMFDGALENGWDLTIYDRNLWLEKTKYQYPSRYLPYIAAPLTHTHTMTMYRKFPFVMNVNTIKYSRSMCANRIYEQQAMGSMLISNYNTFVNAVYPQVQIIFDPEDMAKMKNLDATIINRARSIGIHQMMFSATHVQWLNKIAQFIGKSTEETTPPSVSVIISPDDVQAREMFEAQTYVGKKVVSQLDEVDTHYYTYFSSKYDYAPEYLEDMLAASMYTNCDFTTKMAEGYRYVENYEERELTVFRRKASDKHRGFALDLTFVNDRPYQIVPIEASPQLSVIVPVYNNGTHLEHKCLRSIISNPLFPQLDVILVDDGSTDDYTRHIIKMYSQWYDNIQSIRLPEASGSASTPRNVGIEHAKAALVTFLDPDNEWVGRGIEVLLSEMLTHPEIDVAVGNMIKADHKKTKVHRYYDAFVATVHGDVTTDTRKLLHQMKLKTASIQALITKKTLLQKHNITMVPGALGQDSLFFLTLIHHAESVKVVNHNVHVYYAAITNSMTNHITASFFEKYARIEIEKIRFLKRYGYLSTYMTYRFNYYMRHWYIERLKRSTIQDDATIRAFLKIIESYEPYERPYDAALLQEIDQLKRKVKS